MAAPKLKSEAAVAICRQHESKNQRPSIRFSTSQHSTWPTHSIHGRFIRNEKSAEKGKMLPKWLLMLQFSLAPHLVRFYFIPPVSRNRIGWCFCCFVWFLKNPAGPLTFKGRHWVVARRMKQPRQQQRQQQASDCRMYFGKCKQMADRDKKSSKAEKGRCCHFLSPLGRKKPKQVTCLLDGNCCCFKSLAGCCDKFILGPADTRPRQKMSLPAHQFHPPSEPVPFVPAEGGAFFCFFAHWQFSSFVLGQQCSSMTNSPHFSPFSGTSVGTEWNRWPRQKEKFRPNSEASETFRRNGRPSGQRGQLTFSIKSEIRSGEGRENVTRK